MGDLTATGLVAPAPPYRPLYQDAYDALREAIFGGRLAPGQRIVEAEIARQMAISRAPIREAIRKLERDGLVRYVPRRGVVVSALSVEEVRDVYHMRVHLEAYAARLAASCITADELATLGELVSRMSECAERDNLEGLAAADVEFHALICRASGSKRLFQLWDSLNPHSWTLLTSLRVWEYTLVQFAERHRPVLAALQSRDADRAEAEIRRHINELADRVLDHLNDRDGGTR